MISCEDPSPTKKPPIPFESGPRFSQHYPHLARSAHVQACTLMHVGHELQHWLKIMQNGIMTQHAPSLISQGAQMCATLLDLEEWQ